MADNYDAEYSGEFCVAGSDEAIPGTVRIQRSAPPELRLNGEISPPFRFDAAVEEADSESEVEELLIHGQLVGSPHQITLAGCFTIGRRGMVFGKLAEQTLRARYAIIGACLQGNELLFDQVELRFQNLDSWARLEGFQLLRRTNGPGATISYAHVKPETIKLMDGSNLSLLSSLHAPWQINPRIMRLERLAWIQIEGIPEYTWSELDRSYVRPLQSYLQMNTLKRCSLVDIRVGRAGSTYRLAPGRLAEDSLIDSWADFPFLLRHSGLTTIAEWLDCAVEFSPSSAIISDFVSKSNISLESDLLELCTVAEGMHRSLFPQRNRLDSATSSRIKQFIHCILVGEEPRVADIVKGRFGYIEEMSYTERLKDLAKEAELALPGITGATKKWALLVSEARNTFAHGKPVTIDETLLDELVVAVKSLQWVLFSCLMLNAGVSPELIGNRLGQHQSYSLFIAEATTTVPKVYPRS